jgi:hypothetical protein
MRAMTWEGKLRSLWWVATPQSVCMGQMWYTAALGGMQMRAAARAIIFDKLTRLRCVCVDT